MHSLHTAFCKHRELMPKTDSVTARSPRLTGTFNTSTT